MYDWSYDSDGIEIVREEELVATEAPAEPCLGNDDVLVAMARRTIVAAAKGGRLRRLPLGDDYLHAFWKPFAVPTLLSAWVDIDDWGISEDGMEEEWGHADYPRKTVSDNWVLAVTLRSALFHVHHRLEKRLRSSSATVPRLASSDVQTMHYELTKHPPFLWPPDTPNHRGWFGEERVPDEEATCFRAWRRYLVWLRDDEKLAQQVADAWNAVVERGGADLSP